MGSMPLALAENNPAFVPSGAFSDDCITDALIAVSYTHLTLPTIYSV